MLRARVAVGLVVVAVGIGACSSSAKQTAGPAETPTTATRVAGLGPCPRYLPRSVASLNTGVVGIAHRLVPIGASSVRLCKYATSLTQGGGSLTIHSRLLDSHRLPSLEVPRFAQATNGLPEYQGQPGPPEPKTFTSYLITFARTTQQVSVLDAVGAAPVTNGVFIAAPTPEWNREVQDFAHCTLGQSYKALPTC